MRYFENWGHIFRLHDDLKTVDKWNKSQQDWELRPDFEAWKFAFAGLNDFYEITDELSKWQISP